MQLILLDCHFKEQGEIKMKKLNNGKVQFESRTEVCEMCRIIDAAMKSQLLDEADKEVAEKYFESLEHMLMIW